MGLNIRPTFRLYANSSEITQTIRDRLISLRFTDEVGVQSDILEIVLADHIAEQPIEIPPTGAELDLYLGYDDAAQKIGTFVCDEVEIAGYPGEVTIRARASQFDDSKGGKSNLQTQKTRSWPKDTKLGDVAKKIAKEHGMTSVVASTLANVLLPHMAQTDESDLHFLMRVARKFDAIAKAAGGKLIIARRGESRTASGANMPAVTLTPGDVSRFRVVQSKRETAGEVVAYWHDVNSAKRHEVKVGTGEPVTRLKMQYPTQEMALAAARSDLERRKRGKVTASLTLPGRPDLVAEGKLTLSGFRSGVDGVWSITRAEHILGAQGYTTTIEAEVPTANDTPQTEVIDDAIE